MKSTWSKHAHLWKFLTVIAVTFILSVVLFKAFGNPKQRLKKDSKPRVICNTEDTQETALLKEIRTNETVDLPSMSVLELWSREERTALYHRHHQCVKMPPPARCSNHRCVYIDQCGVDCDIDSYINNIQYLCKSKVRLSKVIGTGWDICDEYTFRPIPPCLVYSFGVNNDFSFEDSVIERYRCEVHSFDKRMGKENPKRDSLHYLHAYDITAINNPALNYVPDLLTYNSILLKLGHRDKSLSILKMSIDSSEWDVLEELSDSKQLGTVDNLVVNFHLDNGASETSTSTYTKALTVLKKLHDSKFRIFWTRQNDSCAFVSKCRAQLRTNCHTVSFVRLR